jgi:hypothetical protein
MMVEPTTRSLSVRLAFLLSAALAAIALRFAWDEPLIGVLALLLIGTTVVMRWMSRRRSNALLRSGDVKTIVDRWAVSFDRIPHPETMAPLMAATAFAAYGWTTRAREVLKSAERGPAWEDALEHRLFLDALLLTFEGESDEAQRRASALAQLPMPTAVPFMIERIRVLRGAAGALARAFSHQAELGDLELLTDAGRHSPLVHWAMRYGAAISSIDAGDLSGARVLIGGAPSWPSESCFALFHQEIAGEMNRRHAPDAAAVSEPAVVTDGVSPDEVERTQADAFAVVDEEDRADVDR